MSAYEELLDTVKFIRDRTGDPNAWQTGLAPNEVAAVITPTTRSDELDAILRKIHQQHPDLFGATPGGPPSGRPPSVAETSPDREKGDAAEAIADAEAALAHQNSTSSQLDMQVVSAILNAHLTTVEGRQALIKLQQETEAAVLTRSDLDTPAGARDFQRFLIGKLKDIRAVVLNASLDDTSKSALMAAWTSLYDASRSGPDASGDHPPPSAATAAAPPRGTIQRPPEDPDTDPLLDSLLADAPARPAGDASGQAPTEGGTAPAPPTVPVSPSIPSIGTGLMPGPGTAPSPMAGWGVPGGLPLSGPPQGSRTDATSGDVADGGPLGSQDRDPGDHTDNHKDDRDGRDENAPADQRESPPAGPTTVTLPNGETVTAASPQLAAAIKSAVGGIPIADAFQQEGIAIPPAGTAVTNPIGPLQVTPGDIGMFTDRHALALGHSKALLDGQIQHIATVSGPSFLGWEHPPAATTASAPASSDPPTPTRPAGLAGSA